MKTAIIGAGMAGLSCGAKLKAAGHEVTLFDKGRGPGGRMATRRAEVNGDTLRFDHGAQFFTAKDPRFAAQIAAWETEGVVLPWPVAKENAWVGAPGMNAPIKAMAAKQNVSFGVRVEAVGRSGDGWRLDGDGVPDTVFETLLIAVPAEQVSALAAPYVPDIAEAAEATQSDPCWTLMVAFDGMVEHSDTLRDAGAIGWAARNSAKPGRNPATECWVVQGSSDWSREHLEQEKGVVAGMLLDKFREQVGGSLPEALHSDAHRWRYAMSGGAGQTAMWNGTARIGACGDWLVGPRVESAFISGVELAERVLADG